MLYRPTDHKLWDTTIIHDGSHFQLFYIAGNGVLGRARSADWIRWEPLPPLDLRGEAGSWNENGLICNTVLRTGDHWSMMAGGGTPDGDWQMGLFTSPDLREWQECPQNPVLRADGEIYTRGPNEIHEMHPAWRDPFIWQDAGGWWHCLMCARRPGWNHASTGAAIAHLRSRDLISWETLPPLAEVGERFLFCEVPSYFTLNGRHYLSFLDMGWGGTREHTPSRDDACGTFYLWAEDFEGPWHWPEDPLLLGADDQCMASWAAKALVHEGRVYLYSQVASLGKASLALTKEVVETAPGVLELRFMDNLEPLQCGQILRPEEPVRITHRPHDSGQWQTGNEGSLQGRADGCGTAATIARDVSDFHLQFSLEIQQGAAAGVVLRATDPEEKFLINGDPPRGLGIFLDIQRQVLEMREVYHVPMHGWGVCFMQSRRADFSGAIRRQRVRRQPRHNQPYHLRVIARAEFLEVYLDDVWQITVAQPALSESGHIELLTERATTRFSQIHLTHLKPLNTP
jgi:hypothetical protein